MKKIAILSILVMFTSSIILGQPKNMEKETMKTTKSVKSVKAPLKKLEGGNVSIVAKKSFEADFRNVSDAKWKRAGTFDEVAFTLNGKEMKGYYDIDGQLVGTTNPATFADIPAKGQKEIKEKYKNYTIGPVIFYDDNEANETDMVLYGVQFEDEDNYFIEMTKGNSTIVLQVNPAGAVFFFKQL